MADKPYRVTSDTTLKTLESVMRLTNNALLKAVRLALYAGTTAVVGLSSGAVFAQEDAASERLDTIVVTGSNIRRVDIETANPVITIDRAQIQKSGKLTVGMNLQFKPQMYLEGGEPAGALEVGAEHAECPSQRGWRSRAGSCRWRPRSAASSRFPTRHHPVGGARRSGSSWCESRLPDSSLLIRVCGTAAKKTQRTQERQG